MRKLTAVCSVVMLSMLLVASASAQMGMRQPRISGVWSPTVGSGAAYQMEMKGQGKMEMEFAVVGTEMVAGKPGHWLEMVMNDPRQGMTVMKMLMVLDAKSLGVKRMIMKAPGEDAMEFPMNFMAQMGGPSQNVSADIRDDGVLVGTESITTPAGTFSCQHWQAKDKSWDAWISDKVAPYGVVKSVNRDGTMTLTKVLTGAKTRITGPVQKMEMPQMP
jgi:hypothetical protein